MEEPSWKQKGEEARKLGLWCDEALSRYSVPFREALEFLAGYWGLEISPQSAYTDKCIPEPPDDF